MKDSSGTLRGRGDPPSLDDGAILTPARAQNTKEAFRPISRVARPYAFHQRAVTLDALMPGHDNRALYRLCDFVSIIGVDDQGLLEVFGRAGKAR